MTEIPKSAEMAPDAARSALSAMKSGMPAGAEAATNVLGAVPTSIMSIIFLTGATALTLLGMKTVITAKSPLKQFEKIV